MTSDEIAQSCEQQAGIAATFGSPMSESLLRRMAEDVRRGGPCLAALEPHMERTRGLASQLLLAAVHRMVLAGQLPDAARYYPSVGGSFDRDALWPIFLDAVPRAEIAVNVQLNDVTRSRALLLGFTRVAEATGLPLRLLEIGASAGLSLRFDHFPFLEVPTSVRVAERRGCDLNPIDLSLDASRAELLCFIWPDLDERFRQLDQAIEIARRVPPIVDRADAAAWLPEQLAEPRYGLATVVYHSVVMPYLTETSRESVRRTIEAAGERASDGDPMAWLSMEPAGPRIDVHLSIWPGGERRLIAHSDYMGHVTEL